jgi:preprotein translocase subunit SecY
MFGQAISTFRNAFKVPDLRKKLFVSLALIAVYRVGCYIPVPFIDQNELRDFMRDVTRGTGGVLGMVNMFTGGAFSNMTIFALGIMPYISAQIILQMLMIVVPSLEKMSKEGEIGRRKINRLTRYGTIGLTAFQAFGLAFYLMSPGNGMTLKLAAVPNSLFIFTTVLAMTTGTAFIMWLGEQITDHGIGNGISLIIAIGIIAAYPTSLASFYLQLSDPNSALPKIWVPVTIFMTVITILGIIYIQEGARRIPIQQAKRVVGRRVMGGATNVLPLKVNTAGVIPVIFASAILQLPTLLFAGLMGGQSSFLGSLFQMQSPYNLYDILGLNEGGVFLFLKAFNAHILLYLLFTGFFCFFYTAVTFNPLDVADNLKKSGSFIPGYRPGKPTAQFIDYVLTRITVVGALFLCVVSVVPLVLMVAFKMPQYLYQFVGGTGLIIVVGVVLQTVQQMEAQLMTHNYEGFRVRRRRRGEVGAAPDRNKKLLPSGRDTRKATLGAGGRKTPPSTHRNPRQTES